MDLSANKETTTVTITPETASKLDVISRRHDKPADVLIAMAVDAMYVTIPPTERNRIERQHKRP
jgi:PIN domain nuclease of toxin-antitoxin system